jgi:hypothetical protein
MSKYYRLFPKAIATLLIFLAINPLHSIAQSGQISLNSTATQNWRVIPETSGNEHATAPDKNDPQWVPAIVPGTVFSSYVADGLEKDPNFGDNIYKVNKAKYDRNFWYRTEFEVPVSFTKENVWLNFRGVNRKADIYLNGNRLGTLDGFMQSGHFNITRLIGRHSKNVITVLVYLPKQPLANVGSPNYVSSAGWDWMPYVPGLNSGITDNVYLSNTGAITINDPWIRASLPTNAKAELKIAMDLKNNSSERKSAVLEGRIMPGNIKFSQKISVGANSESFIDLDKGSFSQLIINSPKLWWPNGYGEPNLYDCELNLKIGDEVSDARHIKFGIKRYSYDTTGHVLHIAINGVPVFIKGGDWGMSEYMLRCRGAEYETKVRLHKEMNFNMIRNWIGSTTDEEFYDACDKYGIMIWDDFWLNANPNLPADINVFNANAVEKIKKFRNHPAIAIWCGENEGWPEPPLNNWLKEDIATFDGGDRYYQPNSHAGNLTGSGPWANKDPGYYFIAYPTGLGGNHGWGMRSELGTAVFTNFESFKKFMPEDKWWPRNEMWNQHFFGPLAFNAGPDGYDASLTKGYGTPKGIEDYCRKAQFLNLETNKAMFEGWEDHMGEDASGLMTWMSQSAYPSLIWQTYDYYYDLTGAFWGVKKACEPLHIQWNPVSNAVKVINTTHRDLENLTAHADVYNTDGRLVRRYSATKLLTSLSNTATEAFTLSFNTADIDLARDKPVYASSTTYGEPGMVNDNKDDTRWSSAAKDDEWIYVDLGQEETINGVGLHWEDAFASAFKIQVSDDAQHWKDVYSTADGRGGKVKLQFPEVQTRYVRMLGIARGTYWGYSLYNFEVFKGDVASPGLTDVHFIKLQLRDKEGKLLSDNWYWRGNKRNNYTALNNLSKVNLHVSWKVIQKDGKYWMNASITNPVNSPAVAFGIRVQAIRKSSGEQILPAVMNDNYFSLLKGETKNIQIEFDGAALKDERPALKVEPYNNYIAR